jgi:8-oxo-dGTP pyrophosphatase MutT (NUDIX family)
LNNTETEIKLKLKEALSRRDKVRILDNTRLPSAVLIPIFYQGGHHHILFTRRSELVKYHKGEISFPGGGYHKDDGQLVKTALRESYEEIGLAPADVEVLGELDDVPTRNSNYIITPFVGAFLPGYKYTPSDFEIAEIIEIPIQGLLTEGCRRDETEIDVNNKVIPAYIYGYNGKFITGATARILKQFLGIFSEVVAHLA